MSLLDTRNSFLFRADLGKVEIEKFYVFNIGKTFNAFCVFYKGKDNRSKSNSLVGDKHKWFLKESQAAEWLLEAISIRLEDAKNKVRKLEQKKEKAKQWKKKTCSTSKSAAMTI